MMFARVNYFEGRPEEIDAGLQDAQEHALPALEQVPGYAGILVLVDRTSGGSIAITLWESEEAMRSSEEAASTIRTESAERENTRIVKVDRYEVAVNAVPVATTGG